jgi:hypothetical protein
MKESEKDEKKNERKGFLSPIAHDLKKRTPWPPSARDRSLSTKLVLTFADRGYHVVSATDPHDHGTKMNLVMLVLRLTQALT